MASCLFFFFVIITAYALLAAFSHPNHIVDYAQGFAHLPPSLSSNDLEKASD
ncbi:TPA: hypothetical protein I7187_18280 [Vibrio vulnificus]|nr:hypothetical protein [Vibrio vulnificus]